METINRVKRGDIVKFNNGYIGIYKFSYEYAKGIAVACSVVYNMATNSIEFHSSVFSDNYNIIKNSDDKDYLSFLNALSREYTKENPDWQNYLTDSSYFEIKDWLIQKICVSGVDTDIDEDGICSINTYNNNIDTTISNIAFHIFKTESEDYMSEASDTNKIDFNKLAETAYEYELDTKHISTSTDVLEMHDDTCHYLSAKLSNIRHGSEVMKSTSSPFTQTQEALFEMVWVCLAELNKRNVNIEDLIEWKLNKIS